MNIQETPIKEQVPEMPEAVKEEPEEPPSPPTPPTSTQLQMNKLREQLIA